MYINGSDEYSCKNTRHERGFDYLAKIVKRDGRLAEFNKEKIVQAIEKAMNRTDKGLDIELANMGANIIKEQRLENQRL